MIMKSNFKHNAISIFFVIFFSLNLVLTNDFTYAFRHSPKNAPRFKAPAHGSVVAHLPHGHKTVHVGKMRYFYHGGVFYERGPSGYVVIAAPIGAVVVGLPAGFVTVAINGSTYYAYAGVYYRKVPSGYVVEAPPEAIVVKETSPEVQSLPAVGGKVSVTAQRLNVRSGPGISHPVIHQLHQGDILTIHGYAPDWLYIKLSNGHFGWVMKKHTTQTEPPASG